MGVPLLCLLSLLLFYYARSESIVDNYPTAHSKHNKIMAFILHFSFDHIDPLIVIFQEYVSMCEGGWDPTVVLHTTSNWTDTMKRYVRQRTYCYRTGASIPVRLDVHDKSVSKGLSMKHKQILREELDNFDFFVYHEDDIIFKYSHLVALLHETKKLNDLDPEVVLENNVIGFQRYRRLMRTDITAEADVFEQDFLEERPEIDPICIKEEPYLLIRGNTHQALWAFTTGQIKMLQKKCSFVDRTYPSREFMSSFLVFGDCKMAKLIPAERFQTFAIWHYYPQHHVSWTPVFASDENIRAGYVYTNPGDDNVHVPCWKQIVERAKAEQAVLPIVAAP